MATSNNILEVGTRVKRIGSPFHYTTGREGEIIQIQDDQYRVKWDGNSRTWINKKYLKTIESKPVLTLEELAFIGFKNEQAAKYDQWLKDNETGTIRDELNPIFLFQGTSTKLLSMIVNGEINTTWMASKALANRGLDKNGCWVGFDKAEEIHGLK